MPLVGDFHYNGHKLLTDIPECAASLSKYRINPGNVGKGDKATENFALMIEAAKKYGAAVRIGVNWGSLDQALLARMMDENQNRKQPLGNAEVVRLALVESALQSAKLAQDLDLGADRIVLSAKVSAVQELIAVYRMLAKRCSYALHLGLTEEVVVAQGILQSMGFRSFVPLVTSCPGCGRTTSDLFQRLAASTQAFLRDRMPEWRQRYPGVEAMSVAVMG